MKLLIPALLLAISIYIFVGPVKTGLADAEPQKATKASLKNALDQAENIARKRADLQKLYNSFSPDDRTKLERLVPGNVDNVRLIIDINSIAGKYGMTVKNVSLKSEDADQPSGALGPSTSGYTSMQLSFGVTGGYDALREFLKDLEKSLRIVDIRNVSFTSDNIGSYNYTISLRTYYLRPQN